MLSATSSLVKDMQPPGLLYTSGASFQESQIIPLLCHRMSAWMHANNVDVLSRGDGYCSIYLCD